MNATTTTATFTNSSDANFRIWGLAFATKLSEAGLVQTADTGQVNWVTVTAPLAGNTFQGYEIWRFADALQATAPVFVKIEYGSSAASANNPAIRFQFGSGSNGSGTLTGSLSTLSSCQSSANAGVATHYWSGGTNRFMCFLNANVAVGNPLMFSFERSKSSIGADTSEAVLVIWKNSGSGSSADTFAQFAWDTTTGMKAAVEITNGLNILLPGIGSGVTGTQIATYPVFHTKGVFMNPGMNCMGYFHLNITALGVVGIPMYGANHNYIPLGSTNVAGVVARGVGTNSLLIRYD